MTPRELLATFETLADAPEGVKRLRELVLQLAVRGKLVQQDPHDEPASRLLEHAEIQRQRLRPFKDTVDPRYALVFYTSPDFIKGGVETFTGTAGQQRVSNDYFCFRPFPLPPLAEQRRIVARVEELMGLLDRLEAARTTRDELRRAARNAVLVALRDARDIEAVMAAWARISSRMNSLFAEPEDISPLRASILEMAGRGLLVRQDSHDEPALLGLQRLADRRSQAVLEGFLREEGASNISEPPEYPFDLPNGWHWCTLQECADAVPRAIQSGPFGSTLRHSEFQEIGRLVIGIDNVRDGHFSIGSNHRISDEKFELLSKYAARPGDLLITVMGTIGRCCVAPEDIEPAIITKHVYRVTLSTGVVNPRFFMHMIRGAPFMRSQIFGQARGLTRDGLNGTIIKGLLLPLPPLAEQHRIVAAIDGLMAMCNGLDARLAVTRELQRRFAAAAVHHLDM